MTENSPTNNIDRLLAQLEESSLARCLAEAHKRNESDDIEGELKNVLDRRFEEIKQNYEYSENQ